MNRGEITSRRNSILVLSIIRKLRWIRSERDEGEREKGEKSDEMTRYVEDERIDEKRE